MIARAVGLRPVDRRVMKLPPLRCAVPRMAALSPSVGDGALLALRGGGEASVLGARLVGWALTGAAVTLYIPMIAELVKNRSAPESMSATTWSLQLLGFVTTVIYHVRMGFPLSTFTDFAALGVQSAVILSLSMFYRRRVSVVAALPVVGLCAGLLAPMSGLKGLQVAAALVTTWALLPQIVRNFQARARGGWSPVAAGLSTIGNAGRLFTTMKLADGNILLLFQFGACFILNALLLVQSIIWDD